MTDRIFPDREQPGSDAAPIRKAHYGPGCQPIDDMIELGWAAHFMAGSILRYLRRDKDREHSLESARRYREWLANLAADEGYFCKHRARVAVIELDQLLTYDEKRLLDGPTVELREGVE
ncbi:MAG: hypothetical protein KGO96_10145 [Elusimicrobia bacterium]|nr:hypothetical protein [Elusimicrobiota bacterium]